MIVREGMRRGTAGVSVFWDIQIRNTIYQPIIIFNHQIVLIQILSTAASSGGEKKEMYSVEMNKLCLLLSLFIFGLSVAELKGSGEYIRTAEKRTQNPGKHH